MSDLDALMARVRKEGRAALIAYVPAGFPTIDGCKKVIDAFVEGGVDAIEIGFPYSDPVMDGPTIQEASLRALKNGTRANDVVELLAYAATKVPSVVMTYWNPIERYGVDAFASSVAQAGGSGVITPDLTIEESREWSDATERHSINAIYVVAPSTSDARLTQVTSLCNGFVYAASLMGVTGARRDISSSARSLVERLRKVTDKPIAVGLGVSTREQAHEVADFADGVIVGSAFVKELLDASTIEAGIERVRSLAHALSEGVRR